MTPASQRLQGVKSDEAEFENKVVLALFSIFGLILIEGLFLAASGFLSKEISDFGINVVYPAFSPTVVVFLLASASYGVWKTREDRGASD